MLKELGEHPSGTKVQWVMPNEIGEYRSGMKEDGGMWMKSRGDDSSYMPAGFGHSNWFTRIEGRRGWFTRYRCSTVSSLLELQGGLVQA